MRAAIFLNGFPDPPDLLRPVAGRADLVVAADGGARYALDAGVVPDLVVGDMDSLGEDLAREVAERGALLERHPVRKDKMDGHLAVLAARERGATAADLLCAGGGSFGARLRRTAHPARRRADGLEFHRVADWGQDVRGRGRLQDRRGGPGDSVSIFPLSGPAAGVTLEGCSYPLENARLEPGDTLGFHNELVGGAGRVSVEEGSLRGS